MQDSDNKFSKLSNDEIDLKELFSIIYDGKWVIGLITSIASILVVTYSLYLPNIYKSTAILVPVESSDGINGALKSYSGLASLAGVSLPPQAVESNATKAMEKIRSLSFFQDNILPNIYLPELMAVESWHPSSNELKFNENIYDTKSNTWVREYKYPQKQVPSAQESFKEFSQHLSFNENKQTGFITVSIKHQSPYVAREWVDLLINQINAFYREKDRNEAEKSVAYLNTQIVKTSFTEIKQVVAALLQQETQKLTLIEANEAYVFDYIDPPVVMERKSEPYRALICLLGAIIGGIFGIVVVLINHFRAK